MRGPGHRALRKTPRFDPPRRPFFLASGMPSGLEHKSNIASVEAPRNTSSSVGRKRSVGSRARHKRRDRADWLSLARLGTRTRRRLSRYRLATRNRRLSVSAPGTRPCCPRRRETSLRRSVQLCVHAVFSLTPACAVATDDQATRCHDPQSGQSIPAHGSRMNPHRESLRHSHISEDGAG